MADQQIRVAVVGLGQGLENVYVTLQHPRFQLKAVCDTNDEPYRWITGAANFEDAAVDIAKFDSHIKFMREIRKAPDVAEVDYIPSYDDVLARSDIDAVILVLPDPMHKEFVTKALQAGKYVLSTKPMAESITSAIAIAEAAQQYPGRYMLGFQISNSSFARNVLDLIESGILGEPRQIRFDYHRKPWRPMHSYKNGPVDGTMLKEGTHWLDLIYRLNGQRPWTRAAGFSGLDKLGDTLEFEDNGVLAIDYEHGFRAVHTFSYFRRGTTEEDFLLVGEKGTVRGNFTQLALETDTEKRLIEIRTKQYPAEHHHGYVAMHDEFARMVLDGIEPYSNWRTGLENMLTCHATQLAVAENRLVLRSEVAELDWRLRPSLCAA